MIAGIGIDLVEVGRIKEVINRRGDPFLNRIFTANELKYCKAKRSPYPNYACRFAAKESVFKALGKGWRLGMAWTEIEVLNNLKGQPYIALHGKVEKCAQELGINRFLISLTHTRDYAFCKVLALKD